MTGIVLMIISFFIIALFYVIRQIMIANMNSPVGKFRKIKWYVFSVSLILFIAGLIILLLLI